MELLRMLGLLLFSVFLLFSRTSEGHTFNPLSYSHQHFYSFEKIPSHEIRRDVQAVLKNFLTVHVKNLLQRVPSIRLRSNGASKSEHEEIMEEQINSLTQQAENKRTLSARIKESYERALKKLEARKDIEPVEERTSKILAKNLEQVEYLNNKADSLDRKAKELKEQLKEYRKEFSGSYMQNHECQLEKEGNLKFVSSTNGLKHAIDEVQAHLNGEGFNILKGGELKMTFKWRLIEMPVKIIGNAQQCFFFTYRSTNQLFCAKDKLNAYSWMNGLTEGYLCHHFGLKGSVVNREMDLSQLRKQIPKTSEEELRVEIRPEEGYSHVKVDDMERDIEDTSVIDINKIKKAFEEERMINKKELVEESAI